MIRPPPSRPDLIASNSLNSSSLNVATDSEFRAEELFHYQVIGLMKTPRESSEQSGNHTEEYCTRRYRRAHSENLAWKNVVRKGQYKKGQHEWNKRKRAA
jgi:hypothetical protein